MKLIAKYHTANLDKFFSDIEKYSIGMDEWLNRMGAIHQTETNYPPYNTIKENETEFRLEIALAGFKKNEITVYTENNKLFVEGKKEVDNEKGYIYHGLANRAFTRVWTISDDVQVTKVYFEDGLLTIKLKRIIPEHQRKQVWF